MNDNGSDFNVLIEPILAELSLQPTQWQLSQLRSHYDLLRRWNLRMNLTAIRRPRDIVRRHFGESLYLSTFIPNSDLSLVDVGSGAGFPGVPIAVMKQAASVTLIESVRKKATFLREATRGLHNLRVIASRAEEVDERFDWATVRAVSPSRVLPRLLKLASNLAFLVTDEASRELRRHGELDWATADTLPWSAKRCLLIGKTRSGS